MIQPMPKDIYKSEYDYAIPEELIAKFPPKNRVDSKLLSYTEKKFNIDPFKVIPKFFQKDDLIVFNETKVFRARLLLTKESGGKVEILINKIRNKFEAICLTKGLNLKKKKQLLKTEKFPLKIVILNNENSLVHIKFNQNIDALCESIGHVPIPPYLNRADQEDDKDRYQTVFANHKFIESAAAPTASLHFDEELFNSIRKSFNTCKISLAVGLGTFKPLPEEPITESSTLHDEDFFISDEAAQLINKQIQNSKRIVSIGTTTLRALEAAWCKKQNMVKAGKNTTNIFIKEGYEFNVVNSLVTNFHLPQSSLLMLVSAFSGKEFMLSAYKHAIEKKLRFFSYGDAMIIER
jgi:S-adenosylmethionine:tRNA ribosyltransferase-isomerase